MRTAKAKTTSAVGSTQNLVKEVLKASGLNEKALAKLLGSSYISVVRWGRGDIEPANDVVEQLRGYLSELGAGNQIGVDDPDRVFASTGIRRSKKHASEPRSIHLLPQPGPPILSRLCSESIWSGGRERLVEILCSNAVAARTVDAAAAEGVSAGKNTYTYDAHTYHTKVPPQGIAQVLRKYLPEGGVVLDPFGGSGMTGVAALTTGHDVILNELSPAASFIADRFTSQCDPSVLAGAVRTVVEELKDLRRRLYTTQCRTCGQDTELLFTVWSYRVRCSDCNHEFVLWDECRQYGRTVREHKILREFPCPSCNVQLKKSRLVRTTSTPVLVGYKCCAKTQMEVEPSQADLDLISAVSGDDFVAAGFVPDHDLPEGVNLSQPKRHGLSNIKLFYTPRNLAALSQIWRAIHRIEDPNVAGFIAFVFTSLYQRVTKLSEFRFWGGSGNTANFNVPYIYNEANVFVTFERKARTIIDHLDSTAKVYSSKSVVVTGSATKLTMIPDNSIDLIFTDPPFGANINYSEMNLLWESWLGVFTDNSDEAIVNRAQKKSAAEYQQLMAQSLAECYRVLRPGHWLVLVFMNSAEDIWNRVREAVVGAGFSIERIDIFDKQHGTFKQFVSDNTAGADLMLHCRKAVATGEEAPGSVSETISIEDFFKARRGTIPLLPYLHVDRDAEVDYRTLYSEFLAESLVRGNKALDFASFREKARDLLNEKRLS